MKGIWVTVMAVMMMTMMMQASCARAAQNLSVTFYDVGKADAMLITTPAEERILIDAATNKQGKKLVERFEKEGIDAIDVMIITHYDKDHVGGADQILENIAVGTVIMPVYDKESKQHTQFLEALEKHPPKETVLLTTAQKGTFTLPGGLALHVTAAHENYYGSDEENDFSLAVRMSYGDTRFLFAGDAENARQKELIAEGDLKCDVLKVPYHGRFENISPMFLSEASPKIAYIHDDGDDPADSAIVDILEELGADVYCAKDDGAVTVYSDGQNVWTE